MGSVPVESYGEDTFLLGEMGAQALTESVGQHMATCVKHLRAKQHGEFPPFVADVSIAEADLRDIYLPHFKRCVDVGVDAFMSSYNKVNGEWAGHSRHLLTEILKGDWGFKGFVMSDFFFGVSDMVEAIQGGQDLEMPTSLRTAKGAKGARQGRTADCPGA